MSRSREEDAELRERVKRREDRIQAEVAEAYRKEHRYRENAEKRRAQEVAESRAQEAAEIAIKRRRDSDGDESDDYDAPSAPNRALAAAGAADHSDSDDDDDAPVAPSSALGAAGAADLDDGDNQSDNDNTDGKARKRPGRGQFSMYTEIKCWSGNQGTKVDDIRGQQPEHIWTMLVRLLPATDAMTQVLLGLEPLKRGQRKTAACKEAVTEMQTWWRKNHNGQHARLSIKIVELFYYAAIRAEPAAAKHLKDGILPSGKSLISGSAHTDPSAVERLARRVVELHQRHEEVNARGRVKQGRASAQAAAAAARDNAGEHLLQHGSHKVPVTTNISDSDDDDDGSSSKGGTSSKVLTITPVRNRLNDNTSTSANSGGGLRDIFSGIAKKSAAETRLTDRLEEVQHAKVDEYTQRAEAQKIKTDFVKKDVEAKLARTKSETLERNIQQALEQADRFDSVNPVMAQQLRTKAEELSAKWMKMSSE